MRSVVTFLLPNDQKAYLFGDVIVFYFKFESQINFTPRRFELSLVRSEEYYRYKWFVFPVHKTSTTLLQSLCIHQSQIRTVWPAGSYNWQVRMTLPSE